MSTRPHTTPDTDTGPTAETTEPKNTSDAPRTFDPFNTCDCPDHFTSKWADTSDRPAKH